MSVETAWRPTSEEATLNARLSLATLDAAARRGVPADVVLREVGVDGEALLEEDARIPVSVDQAIWRTCEGHLGASLRGLDVLAVMPRGALGLADMLFSTAPTFGDAIRTAAEFMPLVRDGLSVDLTEHADVLRIARRRTGYAGVQPSQRGSVRHRGKQPLTDRVSHGRHRADRKRSYRIGKCEFGAYQRRCLRRRGSLAGHYEQSQLSAEQGARVARPA